MAQLGLALQHMVALMANNMDTNTPFIFIKLGIKDRFWQMLVSDNNNAWNFAYVLPSKKPPPSIGKIQLVIPNSLQMGLCELPPYFCSGSETTQDIVES